MKPQTNGALQLIALFKLAKALTMLAVAAAAFGLLGADVRASAAAMIERTLTRIGEGTEFHAMHSFAAPMLAKALDTAAHWVGAATPGGLAVVGGIATAYAALLGAEGVGLWLARRWAERLSVVATGLLIPLELFEVVRRVTFIRVGILVLNVLAVAYLVQRVRAERRA